MWTGLAPPAPIETQIHATQSSSIPRCKFQTVSRRWAWTYSVSRRARAASRRSVSCRAATAPADRPAGLHQDAELPFRDGYGYVPDVSEGPAGNCARDVLAGLSVSEPLGALSWREGITDHQLVASTSSSAAGGRSGTAATRAWGHRRQRREPASDPPGDNGNPIPRAQGLATPHNQLAPPHGHAHMGVVADLSASVSRWLGGSGASLREWLLQTLHGKPQKGGGGGDDGDDDDNHRRQRAAGESQQHSTHAAGTGPHRGSSRQQQQQQQQWQTPTKQPPSDDDIRTAPAPPSGPTAAADATSALDHGPDQAGRGGLLASRPHVPDGPEPPSEDSDSDSGSDSEADEVEEPSARTVGPAVPAAASPSPPCGSPAATDAAPGHTAAGAREGSGGPSLPASAGPQSSGTPWLASAALELGAEPWVLDPGSNLMAAGAGPPSRAAPDRDGDRDWVELAPPPVRRRSPAATAAAALEAHDVGLGSRRCDVGSASAAGWDAHRHVAGSAAAVAAASGAATGAAEERRQQQEQQALEAGLMPVRVGVRVRVLTSRLKRAPDWRTVAELVREHEAEVDAIHVSAALVRLAKLHRADPRGLLAAGPTAGAAPGAVGHCGPANTGAGVSTGRSLGQGASPAVGAAAAAAAAPTATRAEGWAVQSGGGHDEDSNDDGGDDCDHTLSPPDRTVHPEVAQLVSGLLERLPGLMPRAGPRTVSNMLWALGVLQPLVGLATGPAPRRRVAGAAPPLPPTVTAAGALLVAKMRHFWREVGPSSLSLALWGMARLGLRPGPTWVLEFESASVRLLSRFSARELGFSLWALAAMRLRPDAPWLTAARRALAAALARELERGHTADVVRPLQQSDGQASGGGASVATSEAMAGAQAQAAAAAAATTVGDADAVTSVQSITTVLWACAVLSVRLEGPELAAVLSAYKTRLRQERGTAGPQVLSVGIMACARLGLRLPQEVLVAWREAAAGPCLSHASAQDLSCMVWSLARLRAAPPGPWVSEWAAAFLGRAREGAVRPQALCSAVAALAQLDARVTAEWLQALTSAAAPLVPLLSPKELGVVLHGLGRLAGQHCTTGGSGGAGSVPVAATFLAAADAAAAAALPSASLHDLSGIGGGLRALRAAGGSVGLRVAVIRRVAQLLEDGVLRRPGHAAECLAWLASAQRQCTAGLEDGGYSAAPAAANATAPGTDGASATGALTAPPIPLVAALVRRVVTAKLTHYDIFNVGQALCAAAELGYVPPTPMARRAVGRAAASVCGGAPGARPVLRLLQGLYGMRIRPPPAWLSLVASQIGGRLRCLTGEELEDLLRLLHALRTPPPPEAPVAAAAVAEGTATEGSPSRTAPMAALPHGRPSQPQPQPQQHLQRPQPRQPCELQRAPEPVTALLTTAQPALAACPVQHLLQLAGALVAVGTPPDGGAAAAGPAPSSPLPVSSLLPPGWLSALEAASVSKLSLQCVSASALVELLACFGCLAHVPDLVWTDAWYQSTARRLATLRPQHLCMALQLQRRLGLRPPLAWLRNHAAALAAVAECRQLPPMEVLAAVAELQRLGLDDVQAAAAAPRAPALSGLVAAASAQLRQELAAAEPAQQLASLASLQALADPRVAAAPQSEGWAVGVLAMAHSVIVQRPLHQLLVGLQASPPPGGEAAAAPEVAPSHPGAPEGAGTATAPGSPGRVTSSSRSGSSSGGGDSGGGSPQARAQSPLPEQQTAPNDGDESAAAACPDRGPASAPLVLLMASLARWGHAPSNRWLSGVVRHVCRQADGPEGSWLAADVARVVCCMAALGYVPAADVAERLQQQLFPALLAGELPPALSAELCLAWAAVRRRPPPAWWRAVEAAALRPAVLAVVPAPALVRLLWAMNQLGHVPSYEWLTAYSAQLPRALTALSNDLRSPRVLTAPSIGIEAAATRRHACTASGFGAAAVKDGSGIDDTVAGVSDVNHSSRSRSAGGLAGDLANLALALGTAVHEGRRPPEMLSYSGAMPALLAASRASLGAMGPRELVLLVEGLARCRHRLAQPWVETFTAQIGRQLHVCGPSDMASFIYCLAYLEARPPTSWLATALHRTTQLLPALLLSEEAYRAEDLVWAVSELDPHGDLARPFLASLARQRAAIAAAGPPPGTAPPSAAAFGRRGLPWHAAAGHNNGDGSSSDGDGPPPSGSGTCARSRRRKPGLQRGGGGGDEDSSSGADHLDAPAANPGQETALPGRQGREALGGSRGRGRGRLRLVVGRRSP